jgi:hypothetical protein
MMRARNMSTKDESLLPNTEIYVMIPNLGIK